MIDVGETDFSVWIMFYARLDRSFSSSPFIRDLDLDLEADRNKSQIGLRARGAPWHCSGRKLRRLEACRIYPTVHNHVRFKYVSRSAIFSGYLLTKKKRLRSVRVDPLIRVSTPLFSRPTTREPTTSSGTSRLTVTSETSALATALQTALNGRTGPTRSQSQPVDLAVPSTTQQQTHQAHAWHSQPAAFRRGEYRSG